ncbi:FUSC family protein [Agromyces bauzanensis]
MRTVTVAALCLLAAVALGIVLAVTSAPLWVTALVLAGLLVVTIVAANAAGASPATPTFFVFALLVCQATPTPADEAGVRLLVAVLAAIFAWALSLSGRLLRRLAGRREAALFKPLPKATPVQPWIVTHPTLWLNIGQNVVGAMLSGALALAAGIGHPGWAVVSTVATTPAPGAAHSIARALHRTAGTVVGVGVAGLVLWSDPPALVLVLVVVIAQFATEIFVGRRYGTALVFVTPLALGVAYLANPMPVAGLLVDRVIQTAIGAAVGLVLVLVVRRIDRGREPAGSPAASSDPA